MLFIYCSDPLQPSKPDYVYLREVAAATALNFDYALINFEALVENGDFNRATRHIQAQSTTTLAIYRGWMLKPSLYKRLYEKLITLNIRLLTTPDDYLYNHYLPISYPDIAAFTTRTVWLPYSYDQSLPLDEIMNLLKAFGSQPLIIKDFVKSRKHEWFEACYIPDASNREEVTRVVKRFVELQGDDLNEGLVFRQFVQFEPLTIHSKSGMPLTREFRLFFLDQQPILTSNYWEEGDYNGIKPPLDFFSTIAKRIKSRFFTMDVAKIVGGDWVIVELGDGQVAGLPDHADVEAFYRAFSAL